jgi:prevent-host-death family protein
MHRAGIVEENGSKVRTTDGHETATIIATIVAELEVVMVTRTVSATEAKNRLGAYLKMATEDGEAVVVENRREPSAVIISFEKYQRLLEAQTVLDRQRRLAVLDRIAEIQAERNSDLTEETAEALIQRYLAEEREERRHTTAQTPGT